MRLQKIKEKEMAIQFRPKGRLSKEKETVAPVESHQLTDRGCAALDSQATKELFFSSLPWIDQFLELLN